MTTIQSRRKKVKQSRVRFSKPTQQHLPYSPQNTPTTTPRIEY